MKQRWTFVLVAVVAIFLVQGLMTVRGQESAGPAGIVENVGMTGTINWSRGIIEAVGIGAPPQRFMGKPQARPMALRAAQLDAYRKLLEVTRGVRVNAATLVADFAVESDEIRTEIEGIIKGTQIANIEYLSDGTVEVTLRMDFRDGLSRTVLNQVMPKADPASTDVGKSARDATAEASPYSGLVVDARGMGARPAMAPGILNEKGAEIYGAMQVDREQALQQGVSGYARDLAAARNNPRVADSPLIVKALRVEGPGRSNVVISNDDADRILAASGTPSFLKKCRVMIVLD